MCEFGLGCELCTFVGSISYVRASGYGAVIDAADKGCVGDVNGVVFVCGNAEVNQWVHR